MTEDRGWPVAQINSDTDESQMRLVGHMAMMGANKLADGGGRPERQITKARSHLRQEHCVEGF